MKIIVAYCFPDLLHATYYPLAKRFVRTYMEHPPGETDHEVVVLVNNGLERMQKHYAQLFAPLVCRFHMHNNTGKDIGAFQMQSYREPADLLVCLGAPVRFTRAGWLDRIAAAYIENGPALYGCWGFHQPRDHIRTTAFWCPTGLLNSYPYMVHNGSRYEFEHGGESITEHTKRLGLPTLMVTWNGTYPRDHWRCIDHVESLFLDQHFE